MDSIRIKNVRSIIDSGEIELRKINVLLGKNSSGKSSFLRLFPMLKESARNELRGPILWFDDNYDFGGFSNTLSRHASSKDDLLRLDFSWAPSNDEVKPSIHFRSIYDFLIGDISNVKLNMGIGKRHDDVVLVELGISVDRMSVLISQENESNNLRLVVNGRDITSFSLEWDYSTASLLPKLHSINKESAYNMLMSSLAHIYGSSAVSHHFLFLPRLDLKITNDDDLWKYLESELFNENKKHLNSKKISQEDRKLVEDSIYLMNVNSLLNYIDEDISEYCKHTYYITPLRYNYQRYMRNRDLAVEYIESTGKNVMEYILSLKKGERDHFISFIKKTLNIEVEVEGKENKSIFIKNEEGEKDNIVDVGYGYSQVLPIATTLWDRAYNKDNTKYENTIVIEQPEVHLHPAMQKKLALLFVETLNVAKSRKKELKLIIETHSQPLIERLGRYVSNGNPPEIKELVEYYKTDENNEIQIDKDDIAIYLFNKTDGITTINKTEYDKSGRIENWPIGFLD